MQPKRFLSPANLYFFSLCLLAVGLPLSYFLISVSQFLMGAAWLWDGKFREKLQRFFSNKPALLITGLLVLHLAGLAYTENFSYALKDLRVKLPLFVLPFIISGFGPLERNRANTILSLFIAAVFAGTVAGVSALFGISDKPIRDIRDISLFISHIRFSLLICLSVYFIMYDVYRNWSSAILLIRIGKILLAAWFVLFLLILQSVTGIAILAITGLVIMVYLIVLTKKRSVKIALILITIFLPSAGYLYLKNAVEDFYTIHWNYQKNPEEFTASGNRYEHNTSANEFENGYPIWVYVCWPELKDAWNKRSSYDFDGKDKKGQEIKYTLIRFLTSKGYRKDAEGIKRLTGQEVKAVEDGITNVNYQGIFNFSSRIHVIIWEYDNYIKGGNPSGHSVTQRLEFWKAAWGIICENPLIGVGTGDIQDEFQSQYEETGSSLTERWRLYSHNQYITFTVTFGILGLCYFLFSLLYPLFLNLKKPDFLYLIFWMILVISMFTEDTLETQAGVTFYAFFNAFLLFGRKTED